MAGRGTMTQPVLLWLLLALLAGGTRPALAGSCGQTSALMLSSPSNLCVSTNAISVGADVAVPGLAGDYPLLFSWAVQEGASTPQGPYSLTTSTTRTGASLFMNCVAPTLGEPVRGALAQPWLRACTHALHDAGVCPTCVTAADTAAGLCPLPHTILPATCSGCGRRHVCNHERGEMPVHSRANLQLHQQPGRHRHCYLQRHVVCQHTGYVDRVCAHVQLGDHTNVGFERHVWHHIASGFVFVHGHGHDRQDGDI